MLAGRTSIPAVVAIGVVVGTVIAAVVVLGPPSKQRQRRLDVRRTQDLAAIAFAVDQYWDRRKELPKSLDTLVSDHHLPQVPHDPETDAPYQFTVMPPTAFRLCATFAQLSDQDDGRSEIAEYSGYVGQRSWHHGVGPTCFDLVVHDRSH